MKCVACLPLDMKRACFVCIHPLRNESRTRAVQHKRDFNDAKQVSTRFGCQQLFSIARQPIATLQIQSIGTITIVLATMCAIYIYISDVCLEAEAKSAASASPRRIDTSPRSCLGLNVMTSKLRYDIIIHNFHLFIFCIYVFMTCKTKFHLCTKRNFQMQAKRVRRVLPHEFSLAFLLHMVFLQAYVVNGGRKYPKFNKEYLWNH